VRFACQQCQAKYAIPDERVQNRVIRLRCQKCGSEITIRGPAAVGEPEAAPTPAPQRSDDSGQENTKIASLADLERIRHEAAAQAAAASKAAPPVPRPTEQTWLGAKWHVIIKGAQVGPLSAGDIGAKVAAQELTARTYAWREDMADWQRLESIPTFAPLFAAGAPPKPAAPPPLKKAEAQKIAALVDPSVKENASATPWSEAAAAPVARTNKQPALSEVADLFGPPDAPPPNHAATPSAGFPNDSASARGSFPNDASSVFGGDAASGAPRESTRVFIAAAGLVNRRKRQRLAALAAGATVVALLTVVALDLGGVIEIPALGLAYKVLGVENPHAADLQSQFSSNLTDAERLRLRQGLMGGKKKEPSKSGVGNAPASHPTTGALTAANASKPDEPEGKPQGEQKMLNDLFQDSSKVEMKVVPPTIKTPEADVAHGLGAEQISHVVEGNQKAVKFCFERAMKKGQQLSGKMEVEFTIAPTGLVAAVEIKTPKYKDTEFAECTAQAIKGWKFPRFSGDPVAVEYPFILSAGL
jgi:hypothetical protein